MYRTDVDSFEAQAKTLIAGASRLLSNVDEVMPITPLKDKDPRHFLVHIAYSIFVAATRLLVFAFQQMPLENWPVDEK